MKVANSSGGRHCCKARLPEGSPVRRGRVGEAHLAGRGIQTSAAPAERAGLALGSRAGSVPSTTCTPGTRPSPTSYLARPATRLMVAARITAPNR